MVKKGHQKSHVISGDLVCVGGWIEVLALDVPEASSLIVDELLSVARTPGWTCEENCGYECMHSVTEMHVKAGIPVRQFYGKVGARGSGIECFVVINVMWSPQLYETPPKEAKPNLFTQKIAQLCW